MKDNISEDIKINTPKLTYEQKKIKQLGKLLNTKGLTLKEQKRLLEASKKMNKDMIKRCNA